jgi:hypothetical protein
MSEKPDYDWIYIFAALIVIVVMFVGMQSCNDDDCTERGGKLVKVNSVRDPLATVCIEPEPKKD